MSTPNLCSRRPVEMYGCVTASTSGFTRIAIDACDSCSTAIREMRLDFCLRFAVESVNPFSRRNGFQRRSCPRRKRQPRWIAAGRQHAVQFAAGDDIECPRRRAREASIGKSSSSPSPRNRCGAAVPSQVRVVSAVALTIDAANTRRRVCRVSASGVRSTSSQNRVPSR